MSADKFALAASDAREPVIVAIYETQAEYRQLGMHSHSRGQLAGVRRGLLTMGTEAGAGGGPAHPGVGVPPRRPHYGYTHGAVEGWSCYVAEAACAELPGRPCTIKASGLLREAVIRASSWQGEAMDAA